jgi:hypothetical protein
MVTKPEKQGVSGRLGDRGDAAEPSMGAEKKLAARKIPGCYSASLDVNVWLPMRAS